MSKVVAHLRRRSRGEADGVARRRAAASRGEAAGRRRASALTSGPSTRSSTASTSRSPSARSSPSSRPSIVYRYLPHTMGDEGAMHGAVESMEDAAELGLAGTPPIFADVEDERSLDAESLRGR